MIFLYDELTQQSMVLITRYFVTKAWKMIPPKFKESKSKIHKQDWAPNYYKLCQPYICQVSNTNNT